MTADQAMAALHWPGYLEIGEPDITARIAEYGDEYEQWPCDEWDWAKRLPVQQADGQVVDHGPVFWNWESPVPRPFQHA